MLRATGSSAILLLIAITSSSTGAAAKTISAHETVHLHYVSLRGSLLKEKGTSSGTYSCPVVAQLNFTSTHARFSFTLECTSKNTISGSGLTSYYASGATAQISGSVAVNHGTGQYAHVSAPELQVSGTFQRETFALVLSISGQMQT